MAKPKINFEFAPEDRIDHYVHGTGTIVEVTEQYTTIDFDEVGTKKFVTSMVKLTSTDVPAPTKRKRTTKKKTKTAAKKKTTKTTKATKTTTKKAATKKKAAAKTTKKKKS